MPMPSILLVELGLRWSISPLCIVAYLTKNSKIKSRSLTMNKIKVLKITTMPAVTYYTEMATQLSRKSLARRQKAFLVTMRKHSEFRLVYIISQIYYFHKQLLLIIYFTNQFFCF